MRRKPPDKRNRRPPRRCRIRRTPTSRASSSRRAIKDVVDEAVAEPDNGDNIGGAVGEVMSENNAVARQIEETTQNVETLEAATKAKVGD